MPGPKGIEKGEIDVGRNGGTEGEIKKLEEITSPYTQPIQVEVNPSNYTEGTQGKALSDFLAISERAGARSFNEYANIIKEGLPEKIELKNWEPKEVRLNPDILILDVGRSYNPIVLTRRLLGFLGNVIRAVFGKVFSGMLTSGTEKVPHISRNDYAVRSETVKSNAGATKSEDFLNYVDIKEGRSSFVDSKISVGKGIRVETIGTREFGAPFAQSPTDVVEYSLFLGTDRKMIRILTPDRGLASDVHQQALRVYETTGSSDAAYRWVLNESPWADQGILQGN